MIKKLLTERIIIKNKSVSPEKSYKIINPVSLIDNIVHAENNAFILERSKKLNLTILKEQSQYFSDEENKKCFLEHLNKLDNEEITLAQHGSDYLDTLSALIRTYFKNVPSVIEELKDELINIETLLKEINEYEKDNWENIVKATENVGVELSEPISKIEELQNKNNSFKNKIKNKIDLTHAILCCCKKDKEEKASSAYNSNTNQDLYDKNYPIYQTNIDILDNGKSSLEKLERGLSGIIDNFETLKRYYTFFLNMEQLIVSKDEPAAIGNALRFIRPLIKSIDENLPTINNFSNNLLGEKK